MWTSTLARWHFVAGSTLRLEKGSTDMIPSTKDNGDIEVLLPHAMMHEGRRSGKKTKECPDGTGVTDIYFSATQSFMGKDPESGEMVPMFVQMTVRSGPKHTKDQPTVAPAPAAKKEEKK